MRLRLVAVALAMLAAATSGFAAEEYVIKNAGIARTVSSFGGPLRTNKVEVNGVQILSRPGVEFQIDLDYKDEPVSLVPGDFDVKNIETAKDGREMQTSIRLQCHRDGVPSFLLYVRYRRDPLGSFQQKFITIPPCKEAPGAVLRRIVIDDLMLSPEFEPVRPAEPAAVGTDGGDGSDPADTASRLVYGDRSEYAAFDQKSKRGVFFFVASPVGREAYIRGHGLTMWENVYAPLERGYETGRATIGAATGSPEVTYKRFREFLWEDYSARHDRHVAPGKPSVTPVHSADVAEDKIKGATGVLAFDLDDWKLAGALKPGWMKEADLQPVEEFRSACDKLRKSNPDALIRLVAPGPQRPDLLRWLGIVDGIEWAADKTADPLTSRRLRYADTLVYPPLTLATMDEAVPDKLATYAGVSQHLFGMPDGKSIEGEGHIINNKGFLVLRNPTGETRTVALPLDEPELELKGTLKLTDRTQPDSATELGTVRIDGKVAVDVPAGETRVIGVNLGG